MDVSHCCLALCTFSNIVFCCVKYIRLSAFFFRNRDTKYVCFCYRRQMLTIASLPLVHSFDILSAKCFQHRLLLKLPLDVKPLTLRSSPSVSHPKTCLLHTSICVRLTAPHCVCVCVCGRSGSCSSGQDGGPEHPIQAGIPGGAAQVSRRVRTTAASRHVGARTSQHARPRRCRFSSASLK